jgi:thiamine pyrophosphate-dependent acetolactate synthase large subunit-like protein
MRRDSLAAGVERIYGFIRDSLNGLTDAIRRQSTIEWIHVRHEDVAPFPASADAHLTGSLRLRRELRPSFSKTSLIN